MHLLECKPTVKALLPQSLRHVIDIITLVCLANLFKSYFHSATGYANLALIKSMTLSKIRADGEVMNVFTSSSGGVLQWVYCCRAAKVHARGNQEEDKGLKVLEVSDE